MEASLVQPRDSDKKGNRGRLAVVLGLAILAFGAGVMCSTKFQSTADGTPKEATPIQDAYSTRVQCDTSGAQTCHFSSDCFTGRCCPQYQCASICKDSCR